MQNKTDVATSLPSFTRIIDEEETVVAKANTRV